MEQILFWIYIVNASLLLTHEIDSAYWKEWHQFNEVFGWFSKNDNIEIQRFLLIHIPVIILILVGVKGILEMSIFGIVMSFVLCFAGIFAFFFHGSFIRKKHKEFNTPISKAILLGSFIFSICQAILTLILII